MKIKSAGFTLMELLIVVVIIGILSAVALPAYRKAVEKSRVADALSTMDAVAKSEHGWYLANGRYTDDFANLDIALTGEIEDEQLKTSFYNYELLDTGIIAERNNGEYFIYKDYETNQILCIPGTHYICEDLGAFTKVPCEDAGMVWANSNSTCYVNNEARCNGLYPNDGLWNIDESFCGYIDNVPQNKIIDEGMICRADTSEGCLKVEVQNGGVCRGEGHLACERANISNGGTCQADGQWGCAYAKVTGTGKCLVNEEYSAEQAGCLYVTLTDGGRCVGNSPKKGACGHAIVEEGGICEGTGQQACNNAQIKQGGICVSSAENACSTATYTGTGCCCGSNCGDAPPCDPARCVGI